jgi:hypothetical protein
MLRSRVAALALTAACAVASDAAAQSNLRATVAGNVVTLAWSGTAQNWQVEAGTVQGAYPIVVQTGSAAPGLVAPGVPNGRYYVRVRAVNNGTPSATATSPINFLVGPAPPTLSRTVNGNTLTLNWTGSASAWRLEAGSATGLSDIAVAGLGSVNTFTATNVPNGTYFLRVRSNDGGVPGTASNEVQANVTQCIGTFRTDLHALVNGTTLSLDWSILGSAPTGWRLEAGTATNLSNLGVVPLPGAQTSLAAGLGPGKYFIRLRRNDSCGSVSNEVEVDVPGATQCPVLVPSLVAVPALATNTLNIALAAGCAWVAETSTQWITLLNTQGTGSVAFRFSTSTPNPPVPPGTTGEIRFRTKNGRYAMQVGQQ